MHKGIGAAPFAIVAALIIALAGGLWATQPAQAADDGDVLLNLGDMTDTAFVDPGDEKAFGPSGRVFEIEGSDADANVYEVEASFSGADIDGNNDFRGAIGRGQASWVEMIAGVDSVDGDTDTIEPGNTLSITVEVSGEASLSSTSTLSVGRLRARRVGHLPVRGLHQRYAGRLQRHGVRCRGEPAAQRQGRSQQERPVCWPGRGGRGPDGPAEHGH